ncbi:hypothetical protein U0C82_07970 [Fulvimarina sp. 2208YS6-2-32]|uniref:LPS-assembly lipoprotein n=1 Tax=Fulvimarina uroteuthidis TaxID=3098149 RepID=A0ABU5I118_9HYPH|nr:hypothetical protein [Fulvimarina sp. 2208YS6-2-32]MDY8109080.1 hypothetical protein [Fulvimarina sp. 2208YS6-2-32]
MWSSDRLKRAGLATGLVLGLAALSACTARPLYADPAASDEVSMERLASLRGRIAVTEPITRTDQIVRNGLLTRLNAGARVENPLYEVRLEVAGQERGISIEEGGIASASVYVLRTRYSLVRLSDNAVIDSGSREIITPFDRTQQLFLSQRALMAARKQAGAEAAAQLEIAIATALQGAGA